MGLEKDKVHEERDRKYAAKSNHSSADPARRKSGREIGLAHRRRIRSKAAPKITRLPLFPQEVT